MPLLLILLRIYLWHLLFYLYVSCALIIHPTCQKECDLGNSVETGKRLLEGLRSRAMEKAGVQMPSFSS